MHYPKWLSCWQWCHGRRHAVVRRYDSFGRNGFAGGSANRRNRFGSGGNGNWSGVPATDGNTGNYRRLGHRGRSRKYQLWRQSRFAVHATAVDGVLYLFDSSGTQLTGWQKIDETWHYYDSVTYEAAVGAQQIDGTAYLFDYSGAQKTGWRTVDGVRRYYDPETGKPDSGWVSYGDYRYYVSADSGKATGEFTVDGVRYQSDSETGTQKLILRSPIIQYRITIRTVLRCPAGWRIMAAAITSMTATPCRLACRISAARTIILETMVSHRPACRR